MARLYWFELVRYVLCTCVPNCTLVDEAVCQRGADEGDATGTKPASESHKSDALDRIVQFTDVNGIIE